MNALPVIGGDMRADHPTNLAASINDVLATEELARRPTRDPDYEAENRALAALAQKMAVDPRGVLQTLAELVLELCRADSAGICILEPGGEGDGGAFRWHAAAGQFVRALGATMPRDASPCGTVISRNSVLLFKQAERYFPALLEVEPPIYENLLAPWTVNGQTIGTVWAISHSAEKRFEAEDARLLQSLANFASAAYQMSCAFEEVKAGKEALERRVEERTRLLSESNEALRREVGQRRKAEAARREIEDRFRRALQPENVGIIFFDTAGAIFEANDAFLRMSGYSREDVAAGRLRWDEMTPPEWMPESLRAIEEFKSKGHTTPYEKEYLRKDGSRWCALFASTRIGDKEGVEYIIDITDRKHAEQALKDADRRKDEFLATLAHELRNPLAPISNAMHLLKAKDGRRTTDRLIEMVQRQVSHIVRLVDDLLEVSRIATGKIELRRAPVALVDILHSAIETTTPLINTARHQFHVSLPTEPLMVDGDSVRLAQVFSNLLNNAAKYTGEGGEIWLTARREGSQAVIAVCDNGIGIPPPMLPHIFEMFIQVQRSGSRSQGGLGIGLTMVRNLVELHGGAIEARSEGPGRGSEFIVRLPLLEDQSRVPAQDGRDTTAKEPLAGQRILVVDDNRDAAESLAMLLGVRGAEVRVAHDGPAALAVLDDFGPHAVVLDIGMPGMNGYEVAERIREQERNADVRLVALTGWGQDADRLQSRASGFDEHFTKPVDIGTLERYLVQKLIRIRGR